MYKKGTDALNTALDAGYYGGPTYAGMNDMQTAGANNMYNFGGNAFDQAGNIMSATGNFGQNYADLYNRASADRAGVGESAGLDKGALGGAEQADDGLGADCGFHPRRHGVPGRPREGVLAERQSVASARGGTAPA